MFSLNPAENPDPPTSGVVTTLSQVAQYAVQYAAVPVVGDFVRGVEAHPSLEFDGIAAVTRRLHLDAPGTFGIRGHGLVEALDVEDLLAGEPERLGTLAVWELERQHAHADQVGPMDALVALRQHRAHAQERR